MVTLPTPNTGRAVPSALGTRTLLWHGALSFGVALGMPVLFHVVGLGAVTRLLYPTAAFLAAGYLYSRRSPWYFGFCVVLFCFVSLGRRLVDTQIGFDPSNPMLLAPYLAVSWSALSILRPATWSVPISKVFGIILGCVAWGYLLACLDGRIFSGLVDTMKWSAGPLVALHALTAAQDERVGRTAALAFLLSAPPMGLYGLVQFIDPAQWDTFWMTNVAQLGLDSIGQPQPFSIRVFSTMNSPGSLGAIMTYAMLLAMRLPALLSVLVVLPAALGLLLAQYRVIWIATAVGMLVVALSGSMRDRARILLLGAALVFATSFIALVPQMRDALLIRVQSLGQLQSDASGEIRAQQYKTFLGDSDANLLIGRGLALTGASARLDGKNGMILDSALLESVASLGLIIAAVYLGAILTLVAALFGRNVRLVPDIAVYRAIAIATVFQLPFGNIMSGESGFGMWVFLGVAFARAETFRLFPASPPSPRALPAFLNRSA